MFEVSKAVGASRDIEASRDIGVSISNCYWCVLDLIVVCVSFGHVWLWSACLLNIFSSVHF